MVKIFSIRSRYSEKIFANKKLVELRRQDIKIQENEKCLIYTTSPVKKITGYFIVKEKIRLQIDKLWKVTKKISGLTKREFMNYFKGCIEGTAIFFKYIEKFVNGLSLDRIRALIYNFNPPQSYCNLDEKIYNLLIKELGYPLITLSDFYFTNAKSFT